MENKNDFLNKLTSGVKNKEDSLKHFNDLVQSKVDKENNETSENNDNNNG